MVIQDDKTLVNLACQRLVLLGEVRVKTMFGGIGLYYSGVMFALVSEGKLYLRSCEKLEEIFQQQNVERFIYTKRGRPVALRYYRIREDLWCNEDLLLHYAHQAIEGAQWDKRCKQAERSQRLKDLPNLTISTERLLYRVGINSIEELRVLGAVGAFLRIKKLRCDLSINFLWSLAGALAGCHVALLSTKARSELLASLGSLEEKS